MGISLRFTSRASLITLALLFLLALATISPVRGDERGDESQLTLERIFSGEFSGESGPSITWISGRDGGRGAGAESQGGGYVTLEAPSDGGGRDLVWNDPATGDKEIWIPAHRFTPREGDGPLSIESFEFSGDKSKLLIFTNSQRVWRTRTRGDYWVLDIAGGDLKKLGGEAPAATMMFATFSPDGEQVAYVRDNDLYVQRLRDERITRLTNDGSSRKSNGTFDWVYEEELMLHNGFRWSPDSGRIAFWQVDAEGVPEFPLVKTLGGLYPSVRWIPYPKVGQTNPAARIGVIAAEGGAVRWLPIPGDPREHYLSQMEWASDSTIVAQQFNRLQNTNRLLAIDAASHAIRTVLTESDEAWVDNSNAKLHWIEKGKSFLWMSERDGWQHAYAVSLGDKDNAASGESPVTLITGGDFDVLSIEGFDANKEWAYFIASPENATQRYLYRAKLGGSIEGAPESASSVERLTPADAPGTHTYDISPDGAWALHTYSTFTSPPTVDLISLPDHRSQRVLVDNAKLREKLAKLKLPTADFLRIEVEPGVSLDGWRLRAADLDTSKKHPLLLHVYGEPAGQTVLDRWPGRTGLWHMFLAQQGYVVASFDNRGTPAPRGRAWRKCVYRQVGVLASSDQAAAVRGLLAANPELDSSQVAIWGWSGGGSMTLNCLLRHNDVFHAGISIAPVPNQRLYDTIYQERYMGLPTDNAEGYRLGSPLTFADKLQGELLLIHGTADDNCHYQGTEALIHDLIAANKQFTMFAYPDRSHSISEGKNTSRHLFQMMTEFLKTKAFATR